MASFAEALPEQPQPERHYNPRFLTEFGTRVIELDSRQFEIHNTNSLLGVIGAVISHEIDEEPRTLEDVAYFGRVAEEPVMRDAVLGFLAEETEVVAAVRSILDRTAAERNGSPALRLAEVEVHSIYPEGVETSEEEPIRDYYASLAFDQIAERALAADPQFDLLKFVA